MKEYRDRRREPLPQIVIKQYHWPEAGRRTEVEEPPKKQRKPRRAYVEGDFTRREDALIKKLYPEHGPHHTAEILDRNPARVRNRAIWLGLGDFFERSWNATDDEYLRASQGKRSVLQVSRVLNRTQRNVEDRIAELGLREECFGRGADADSETEREPADLQL